MLEDRPGRVPWNPNRLASFISLGGISETMIFMRPYPKYTAPLSRESSCSSVCIDEPGSSGRASLLELRESGLVNMAPLARYEPFSLTGSLSQGQFSLSVAISCYRHFHRSVSSER